MEERRKAVGRFGALILAASGFLSVLAVASGQHFKVTSSSLSSGATEQELRPRKELPGAAVSVEGLIRLDVTVADQTGKSMANLQRADFKLLDDGQPQKIIAFQTSKGFPDSGAGSLRLIILIDTLGVPSDAAALAREQVAQFLGDKPAHLTQPVMIYSLEDSGLFLTADSSTDGQALAADVTSDRKVEAYFLAPHVHSPLKVAVDPSLKSFPALAGLRALWTIATAEARRPEKKLLFWIGPGLGDRGTGAIDPDGIALLGDQGETQGFLTTGKKGEKVKRDVFQKVTWFSALLRQARVTLDCFSIVKEQLAAKTWRRFLTGVPAEEEASWMNLFKNVLAVQSGGGVATSSEGLVKSMKERAESARTFYSLTFDPPVATHQDEYHSLKVQLDRPDLTADTSTGYYDEPFYNDPPKPGAELTTVAQLEQILQRGYGGSSVAHELSNVLLTERLGQAKLRSLLRQSHDKKVQEALALMADQSTFLDPPPAELSAGSAPDEAEQRRIIKGAADYLDGVIPKLPNFFATRTTFFYGEVTSYPGLTGTPPSEPLHLEQQTKETVLYRKGAEVVTASSAAARALETYGTFGPILRLLQYVMKSPANISWGWWEESPEGRLAVFRYRILGTPVVTLTGCCFPNGGAGAQTKISSDAHGEFAVDPATGAILRLQTESDLPGFVPTKQSDMMVSYGPRVIGGTTYMLPLRSVHIMRSRSVSSLLQWKIGFSVYGPYETKMNVFAFDQYHMFRGDSRLLPGFKQEP